MKTPTVWTYWEGRKPPWIELCLESMKKNIPEINILTPEWWDDVWRESDQTLRRTFDKQLPNVKSDFIRSYLVSQIGGIWIDADAIVFRDVREIWQHTKTHDFVGYRVGKPAPQLCSALIAACNTSIMAAAYHKIHRRKLSLGRPLYRLSLGPNTLARARKITDANLYAIPQNMVMPIHWVQRDQYLNSARNIDEILAPDAYCCMLTHRMLGKVRTFSRERLMEGNKLYAVLFRRAFGK